MISFAFYLHNDVYTWKPTDDISVYELAVILPAFISFTHIQDDTLRHRAFKGWYKDLPDNCKRHFMVTKI